jgi:hypothetical protein
MPTEDYIAVVRKAELANGINRQPRPFLIVRRPPRPLTSLEEIWEEREVRQLTVAVVAGGIVATALWLWVIAIFLHWVGTVIWQHIGQTAWLHLLGGGLSIFLSARGMR